tara:strand:- start:84 stop:758 length:675 start_codon:yes stop_codon:yes gene_type:complete
MDDKWYYVMPPNINLMKCELGGKAIEYLWERIQAAREDKVNANKNLAGNIEESLYLKDVDNYFWNNHLEKMCVDYLKQNFYCTSFRNTFTNAFTEKLVMREFWVNFSKQTEFNPIHNHGGAMSFVIWMQIPTRSKEQHNLPISKNTTNPASSDFQFLYTDILGHISPMTFEMDPEINGSLVLFPATLCHQVYPFFECDDYRVSISGNIYFDTDAAFSVDTSGRS